MSGVVSANRSRELMTGNLDPELDPRPRRFELVKTQRQRQRQTTPLFSARTPDPARGGEERWSPPGGAVRMPLRKKPSPWYVPFATDTAPRRSPGATLSLDHLTSVRERSPVGPAGPARSGTRGAAREERTKRARRFSSPRGAFIVINGAPAPSRVRPRWGSDPSRTAPGVASHNGPFLSRSIPPVLFFPFRP